MSFAFCSENISFSFLGFLSSNIKSAYHFELKAVSINRIGRVSLPFSVSLHSTIIVVFCFFRHSINPSLSSSFRRIERTRGVSPGMDSKSLLNRSILRNPMSRIINMVHFLPNTPKLVLIGHLTNFIWGISTPSCCLVDVPSWPLMDCNCNYIPSHIPLNYDFHIIVHE